MAGIRINLRRSENRREGEINALYFDKILRRAEPKLKSLMVRYRIPPEDAEDVLQQALLAFLYNFEKIGGSEAWLLGHTKNRCLLYWREKRRQLYSFDQEVPQSLALYPSKPERTLVTFLTRDIESPVRLSPEEEAELLHALDETDCEEDFSAGEL